jgi:DNA repair exonuclease SbcCD ATPase subunit
VSGDLHLACSGCGYEIQQYAEAVEALEGGGLCPLCGEALDPEALEAAVDGWDDRAALQEGEERAEDLAALEEEEEFLDAGVDFGDEGEEDTDG